MILLFVYLQSRTWPLVALAAAVTAASVWGVAWYRGRALSTAALLKRLPSRDSLIAYIDFTKLRQMDAFQMLDSSKAATDQDYQRFVQKTNFDWTQDLDSALVAFAPTGKYMFVRARFDWKSLRSYAIENGGQCANAICHMPGSTAERQISFFPVQSGLMALAVSSYAFAARDLATSAPGPDPEVPSEPVWLSIPPSMLASASLPEGTHSFARSLEQSERVILAFSADSGGRLAARLNVLCRSDQDAGDIAGQLTKLTDTLRQMIEREHQRPNPADFSGVLTSGSFRAEGRRVIGYWPIEKSFVENVLSGGAG